MSYVPESVTEFDLMQYVDKRIITGLSIYGAYHLTKRLVGPALCTAGKAMVFRKDLKKRYEGAEWVLITGGTEAIGEALCMELAKAGFNLIIMSKVKVQLAKVMKAVKTAHGVQVVPIQYDFADLKTEQDAENLQKKILEKTSGKNVGILVNSVNMSVSDPLFHKLNFAHIMQMMSVNVFAQTVMTRIMTAKWLEERKGQQCLVIDYSNGCIQSL